jgi:hypothetical protein
VAGIYQPDSGSAALDWSSLSVRELSDLTHLQEEDIEQTLASIGLLKYLKGQKIVNTQMAAKVVEEHRVKKAEVRVGQVTFTRDKVIK